MILISIAFMAAMLACFVGLIRPYTERLTKKHFTALLAGSSLGLIVSPANSADLASSVFVISLLIALAGVIYPFVAGAKRWHFGAAAFASFIAVGFTAPPPSPEQVAAQKARQAERDRKTREAEKAEKMNAAKQLALEATKEHRAIVAKAKYALEVEPNYTRAEYRKTFDRVGAATFSKLNDLEPGAAYA